MPVGYRFERSRLERCLDNSVRIEISVHPTRGDVEGEDPIGVIDYQGRSLSAWAECRLHHRHWWDVCPVRELFNEPRPELQGKTLKEDLVVRYLEMLKAPAPKKKAVKA